MFSSKFLIVALAVVSKAVAYNDHWSEDDDVFFARDVYEAEDIYAREADSYSSGLESHHYARGYIQALLDRDLQARDIDDLLKRADADQKKCKRGHFYSKTLYECPVCRKARNDKHNAQKKKKDDKDKDKDKDKKPTEEEMRKDAAEGLVKLKKGEQGKTTNRAGKRS